MRPATIFAAVLPVLAAAQHGPSARNLNAVDMERRSLCPNIGACVKALAPSVFQCGLAVVQDLLDPISDFFCIASAIEARKTVPAGCDPCFEAARAQLGH